MAYKKRVIKDLYVRKANLSILNSSELKRLSRLKYYVIKYNPLTNTFETKNIYKGFSNLTKIIMLDAVISYREIPSEKFKPYFNVYVPTIFIDYCKYAYPNSFLCHLNEIRIEALKKMSEDVSMIFKTQNKAYRMEDYRNIKNYYGLDRKSSYKDRIKALNDYTRDKEAKPSFYLWLAIMYDVVPFIHYLGKSFLENAKYIKDKVFFIYPDRNNKDDMEDK